MMADYRRKVAYAKIKHDLMRAAVEKTAQPAFRVVK